MPTNRAVIGSQIMGGKRRSTNVNPAQGAVAAPGSLDANVQRFQGYAREGVEGYGAMLGQDFTKQVGTLLGDLNGIGALRTGGVTSGVNDLTTNYARNIGSVAKTATLDATRLGQEEFDADTERKYRAAAEKRARKHSLLKTIGTVLGGAGGFALGGPQGAMIGAKVGGSI